ncbi:MAG: hypothetical protein GY862_20170 [Gammaproteobacteria bacterium]|nr:hypothetical protein [Gammaproteobacteria bacterium]
MKLFIRNAMNSLSPFRRSLNIPVLFICFSIAGMTGCATTPYVLNPAKMPKVSMMDSVAVIPFSGPHGSEFTASLRDLLKSQFTLTVPEQAEGIFKGRVLDSSVSDRRYPQRVETCDRKGLFKACKTGTKREFNSSCIERTATFKVQFSIEEGETKNVLYSKTAGDTESDSHCQHESYSSLKSGAELLQNAHASVLREIQKNVAPYYTGGGIDLNPMSNMRHWGWIEDAPEKAEKQDLKPQR